jgi:hypothetical protein
LGAIVNKLNTDKEHHSNHIKASITSMNYHINHIQIPETMNFKPRGLPPKPWATHLLSIFFKSVLPSYPLINKSLFIIQFNQAFTYSSAQPSRKWLAILNLILTVGSKYYQLSEPVSDGNTNDHIFLSRAIALSSTSSIITRHVGF